MRPAIQVACSGAIGGLRARQCPDFSSYATPLQLRPNPRGACAQRTIDLRFLASHRWLDTLDVSCKFTYFEIRYLVLSRMTYQLLSDDAHQAKLSSR
jgi:hypothetical protein